MCCGHPCVISENPIFADSMGEKHNTWRASWIPALLVVVRNRASILLTQNKYIFFSFFILFFIFYFFYPNHFLNAPSCAQCILGLVLCCT